MASYRILCASVLHVSLYHALLGTMCMEIFPSRSNALYIQHLIQHSTIFIQNPTKNECMLHYKIGCIQKYTKAQYT